MHDASKDKLQGISDETIRLLDARAWHGPWCLLKIRGFLSRLGPGRPLRVLIDDPQTTRDLILFLEKQGHTIEKRNAGEMLVRLNSASGQNQNQDDKTAY